ncbi:MAG: carbohydrate ABC transporter permease, partial [Acetanaerobacterium sp.]
CNRRRKLSAVYELMFTLPMAISMSALAMIFKLMLNPTAGIVNHIFGIDWGWFTNKHYALYGILLVCLWMGIAFDFLLFLAALRNVPVSLIEASIIDGAGPLTRFFHIQLPIISPTMFYVVCTNVMLSIMTSGPVMIITEGGPARSTTTLIYMMFTSGYQSSNYSLASCISLVVFALTLGFTLLAFSFERKGVHYE